jgi:GNAT superfamily N-acetyltransferase
LLGSVAAVVPAIGGSTWARRDGYAVAICPRLRIQLFNCVYVERDGADLEAAVAEVEAEMPCWIVDRQAVTPTVAAAAERLGFTRAEPLPALAVTAAELRVDDVPGLEIAPVADAAGLAAAEELGRRAFGVPAGMLHALYDGAVAGVPGLTTYVARAGGEPVATAMSWHDGAEVGIFSVGTPEEHRGRGYGAAVSGHAVRAGLAAGADLAWLHASPLGEPVYRRMGFREVEPYVLRGRPARRMEPTPTA